MSMAASVWASRMSSAAHVNAHQATVIFDGVCHLCAASVRFIVQRDPQAYFQFAACQSAAGAALLVRHGFNPEAVDTFVLLCAGRVLTRSDAAIEVARHLRGGWKLLAWLRIVPRPLRDWAYNFVARHRYQWFGRSERCLLPAVELQQRFLD